ncbi:MAG: divergent polysaccharide deacetylase family protein [Alphaproteobacteria bacterium]
MVPRPGSAKRNSRPRIAVVIDDLGLNPKRARRLIDLDGPLTLAFLPYGYNLAHHTSEAVNRGHEIFLHLPMEPLGDENPGPNALLENLGSDEFERRLLWAFQQVDGIRGFNNHMGSRLTANPRAMKRVMAEARKRNLLFLDSRTSGRSVAYSTAMSQGVPAQVRDIFLDHDPSAENVARQLAKVEKIARRRGHAIAIGHPYDTTFAVLKTWVKDARERGFELVPVSVLIREANSPRFAAAGGPSQAGSGGVHTSVQREAE